MECVTVSQFDALEIIQEKAIVNNLPCDSIRIEETINVHVITASDVDESIYVNLISNYSNLIDLHNKMLDIDANIDGISYIDELLTMWLNDILVNVYKSSITIDSFICDLVELVTVANTNNITAVLEAIQHFDTKLSNIRDVYREGSFNIKHIGTKVTDSVYRLSLPVSNVYTYINSLVLKNEILNSKNSNGDVAPNSALEVTLDNIFDKQNYDIDYITVYVNTFFKLNDVFRVYRLKCSGVIKYSIVKY